MPLRESLPNPEFMNPRLDEMHREVGATLAEARAEGVRSGYLNITTGGGKTRIAANDVKAFLEEQPNARILYLCHDTNILEQAKDEFANVLGPNVTQGQIFGGEVDHESQLTMASFPQLNREITPGAENTPKLYELIPPDYYDYVVVDEGHHAPAETYKRVIKHLNPQFLLGLTATPDRRDKQDIAELFGEELARVTLEDAIAEGYVCPIDYKVFSHDPAKIIEKQLEERGLSLDQTVEELMGQLQDEEILKTINEQLAGVKDPRMAVFCQNVAEAERFAKMLPGRTEAFHSKLDPEEQKRRLQAFRNGELDALTVVNKLNEGVDIPEVNVVAFLRATESQTVYLQQLGRGSRWAEGKDSLLVLDFVANYDRIKFIEGLDQRVKRSIDRLGVVARARNPFALNFSKETLDARSAIERARANAVQRVAPGETPQQKADKEIAARFGVTPPRATRLNVRIEQSLLQRIKRGDRQAEAQYLAQRSRAIYDVVKDLPDVNGLTVDDYFMIGCEALITDARIGPYGTGTVDRLHVQRRKIAQAVAEAANNSGLPQDIRYTESVFPRPGARTQIEAVEPLEAMTVGVSSQGVEHDPMERKLEQLGYEQILLDAFAHLTPRELRVLALRTGIYDGPFNLEDVAAAISVGTREGARKVEQSAYSKIAKEVEIKERNEVRRLNDSDPFVVTNIPEERAVAIRLGFTVLHPDMATWELRQRGLDEGYSERPKMRLAQAIIEARARRESHSQTGGRGYSASKPPFLDDRDAPTPKMLAAATRRLSGDALDEAISDAYGLRYRLDKELHEYPEDVSPIRAAMEKNELVQLLTRNSAWRSALEARLAVLEAEARQATKSP